MGNAILNLPLNQVVLPHIALPLQQLFNVWTVGGLLKGWTEPQQRRRIEQIFDTPAQARHAVATCAAWAGAKSAFLTMQMPKGNWWQNDSPAVPAV